MKSDLAGYIGGGIVGLVIYLCISANKPDVPKWAVDTGSHSSTDLNALFHKRTPETAATGSSATSTGLGASSSSAASSPSGYRVGAPSAPAYSPGYAPRYVPGYTAAPYGSSASDSADTMRREMQQREEIRQAEERLRDAQRHEQWANDYVSSHKEPTVGETMMRQSARDLTNQTRQTLDSLKTGGSSGGSGW